LLRQRSWISDSRFQSAQNKNPEFSNLENSGFFIGIIGFMSQRNFLNKTRCFRRKDLRNLEDFVNLMPLSIQQLGSALATNLLAMKTKGFWLKRISACGQFSNLKGGVSHTS
jgi:hypothetical protein